IRSTPVYTLLPYTTLFRSHGIYLYPLKGKPAIHPHAKIHLVIFYPLLFFVRNSPRFFLRFFLLTNQTTNKLIITMIPNPIPYKDKAIPFGFFTRAIILLFCSTTFLLCDSA